MKWIFCWIGILASFIAVLNLVFYTRIEPLFGIPASFGVLISGLVLMYIGREHLPSLLAYLFSGNNGGDE